MNEAIDNLPSMVRLRCQNPEVKKTQSRPLLHFAHIDYDERTPPSEEQADLMCRSSGVMCPLAEMCLSLGLELEAPVGVWGGRVLVDGKEYHKKENK